MSDKQTVAVPDADELSEKDLEAAAGGDGVSPNVQRVFDNLNQNTAVQFDLPNYVEHNLPLADPMVFPNWTGMDEPHTNR